MKQFRYRNISLAILVSLLFFSCSKEPAEESTIEVDHVDEDNVVELTGAQMKTAGVLLGAIEQKQISGTIRANGVLDVPPQQLVSVSAPMGGFLKSTSLLEGSRVKKGQVVANIENLDFIQIQQDYLEAKGNFEFAKADYERQQNLARENVNSEKTLQQSKTNFTSWQAKYNGLREKLNVLNLNIGSVEEGNVKSSINLYSPINGYVTEVNVNIGKYVNPTDVLFEIVDTEHLHAELIVFERDVPKLKIGQQVRFTLADESKERLATVYLIGRQIGKDRTIQIHCHIDEEDKELLPGMYLNAVVETGGAQVPALPDDAIIDFQGTKYIFILAKGPAGTEEGTHAKTQGQDEGTREEGQHFEMTEIETGHSEFGYTEIVSTEISKLREGNVVVKGAYSLLSKMKNSEEEGGHAH
ncbi:MAG: efflux RND transporter periplasmic adaptor subunit [Cyclobacteriaceae bacterium]